MTNRPSTPTLDDVAQSAGVSTATVSRCLNTPDRVVEKTRLKVMQAVDALGYTPNFGARVMAAKRTLTIGAIIPTMENAIFARGLQTFQEELQTAGYTLLLASSGYQPELEKAQIKSLVARGAEGLLLIGHERDPDIYAYLETQGVHVVVAWTFDASKQQISVGFDNRKAMSALVQKVLELGHRDIGVIAGHSKGNDRVAQRLDGIKDAVAAHKDDPTALRIVETGYDLDGGAAGMDQMIDPTARPSVVICTNDVLAVGAMKQAQAKGLRVPEDISITGVDDIDLARLVCPALTTVHVPHHEMGREAAREIVALVEQKSSGASVALATSVTRRASLAKPKT